MDCNRSADQDSNLGPPKYDVKHKVVNWQQNVVAKAFLHT